MRGLEDLEEAGLITVDRKVGRSSKISVTTELLDQKSKDFVLKGSQWSAFKNRQALFATKHL